MNLPNFLQRLIDENHDTYFEDVTINGFYELGIHDAYKAMCEPALDGKVDRAIERIVLDWLQWCEDLDENLAQNTLTVMSQYREKIRALELKIKELEHDLKILSTGDMP